MAGNPEDFGSFRAPENENSSVADGANARFHDLVYRTDCFPHGGGGGGGMTNCFPGLSNMSRAERELGELYVALDRAGKLDPGTIAALHMIDERITGHGGWGHRGGGHHYPPSYPGGPQYMTALDGAQEEGAIDPSAVGQDLGSDAQLYAAASPYELDTTGADLGQQSEQVIAQNTGIGADQTSGIQIGQTPDGRMVAVGPDGQMVEVTIGPDGNLMPVAQGTTDASGNVLPSTISPDSSAVASSTDYSATTPVTTDGGTGQIDPTQYTDSSVVTTAQNPAAMPVDQTQQTG